MDEADTFDTVLGAAAVAVVEVRVSDAGHRSMSISIARDTVMKLRGPTTQSTRP